MACENSRRTDAELIRGKVAHPGGLALLSCAFGCRTHTAIPHISMQVWMEERPPGRGERINSQHSALSPSSRPPVTEEDGEVEGTDGAILIKVRGMKRRTRLIRPPRAEQLRQVGGIHVAIAVQVTQQAAAD